MELDVFRAGVAPGALTSQSEVKMLLCYILANIGEPMDFEQLYEALLEHSLVNYFELIQDTDQLVASGHLAMVPGEGIPFYTATRLGVEAAAEFENTLPLSVREKALSASRLVLDRQRRLTEVQIEQTPCEGGYMMRLAIPDHGGELMSLQVFSPTKEQCDLLRRRFLNAPLTIYKGVMALLTGDEQVMGKIFTDEKQLF